jgi:antitoxin component of MazEF toxin-antitoxin module
MKIIKRLIKVGNSDAVVVDKVVMNTMNIKKGEQVEVTIRKLVKRF